MVAILVGISVYGGLRMVQSSNQSNERDLVIQQMTVLLAEAKKYALRPKNQDGGEGSFKGFTPLAKLANTDRVTIHTTAGDDWILFQGFGIVNGWDGQNPIQVVAQYDKSTEKWESMTPVN